MGKYTTNGGIIHSTGIFMVILMGIHQTKMYVLIGITLW